MTAKHPLRILAILLHACLASGLVGCATRPPVPVPSRPQQPALAGSSYTSFDGDRFPYKCWLPNGKVKLVIIGFHGIAGASDDLRNLGEHLQRHLPGTAVYAPDIRGQGNDPLASRRGDIRHGEDWSRDAYTFNRLVRTRHPGARVVWFGESMGSLIVLHAVANAPEATALCDALILSSPIPVIPGDVPPWRLAIFNVGASLFPRARISLETLGGQEEVRVTGNVIHQEQAQTNPWHVPRFTLRLLKTLGTLIRTLPGQASAVSQPVLILHGGKDIFSDPAEVEVFAGKFPAGTRVERHYYPESHHLLFYDHEGERILADLTLWLEGDFPGCHPPVRASYSGPPPPCAPISFPKYFPPGKRELSASIAEPVGEPTRHRPTRHAPAPALPGGASPFRVPSATRSLPQESVSHPSTPTRGTPPTDNGPATVSARPPAP